MLPCLTKCIIAHILFLLTNEISYWLQTMYLYCGDDLAAFTISKLWASLWGSRGHQNGDASEGLASNNWISKVIPLTVNIILTFIFVFILAMHALNMFMCSRRSCRHINLSLFHLSSHKRCVSLSSTKIDIPTSPMHLTYKSPRYNSTISIHGGPIVSLYCGVMLQLPKSAGCVMNVMCTD